MSLVVPRVAIDFSRNLFGACDQVVCAADLLTRSHRISGNTPLSKLVAAKCINPAYTKISCFCDEVFDGFGVLRLTKLKQRETSCETEKNRQLNHVDLPPSLASSNSAQFGAPVVTSLFASKKNSRRMVSTGQA